MPYAMLLENRYLVLTVPNCEVLWALAFLKGASETVIFLAT
jgi:hypothetical protein